MSVAGKIAPNSQVQNVAYSMYHAFRTDYFSAIGTFGYIMTQCGMDFFLSTLSTSCSCWLKNEGSKMTWPKASQKVAYCLYLVVTFFSQLQFSSSKINLTSLKCSETTDKHYLLITFMHLISHDWNLHNSYWMVIVVTLFSKILMFKARPNDRRPLGRPRTIYLI